MLAAAIPFGTTGTTRRGHACDPSTNAAPQWMWLVAFGAVAVAITLASSARARKNNDTRAAASVFWVSVVSLVAMVLIAAVALYGFRLGGCME
jgi:cytochrome bd-type quinol oxidase subunit 2